MRYCPNCLNRLTINTINTVINLYCINCDQSFDIKSPNHTLLYEYENINTITQTNDLMIVHAGNDNCNAIVDIKCPKCSHFYMRKIHISDNENIVYVCPKCKEYYPKNIN